MAKKNRTSLSMEIINKAMEYGASLAGIANIQDLKKSPSHTTYDMIPAIHTVGTEKGEGEEQNEVTWPDKAGSAVVIAVEHPAEKPDLDWWVKGLKGGTRGNAMLISVFSKLAQWLETHKQIRCIRIPYHIEKGGVYMKDSAVLGGLGCIGKNNMLISRRFGPRIRLRVMLMDVDLPSTGQSDFDPCKDCKEYCKKVCPRNVFDKKIYSEKNFKHNKMPGRDGDYDRIACNIQMENNIADIKSAEDKKENRSAYEIKYCRQCELICPAGRKGEKK